MANRRQPSTLTKPPAVGVGVGVDGSNRPAVPSAARPAATRSQHLFEREAALAARDDRRAHEAPATDRRDLACAVGLGLAAFVLYAVTAARYPVTGDTPELETVAKILGVAHAPGYPLLTMTAHVFGWLPIGSYALRMSLYSAVCSSACIGVVYATVRRLTPHRLSAVVAATGLALTPVFWQWSIVFEVFALANLLAAVLVHLLVRWYQQPERTGFLVGAAFTFGLALANQQVIVLVVPAIVVLLVRQRHTLARTPRVFGYAPLALAAGLLPYLYAPIAAARHPALDWEDPQSANGLYRLITRAGYGSKFRLVAGGSDAGGNPLVRLGYLLVAIGIVVGLLALVGLIAAHREQRWYFWFSVVAFACTGVLFQIPANINTRLGGTALFVLERFFLLPLVLIAPLAGLGVSQLADWLAGLGRNGRSSLLFVRLVAVAALAVAVVIAGLNYSRVDLSNDRVADQYARDLLNGLQPDDILVANGDETLGPLWYVQHVEHVRPDVSIIFSSALPAQWYDTVLRSHGLRVPADPTMLTFREANASRPFDYAGPVANDGSFNGKYYVYADGLSDNILPEAVNKSPDQLAADNAAKLASYHVPSYKHIKDRSFESTILDHYVDIPAAVAQQYEQLKLDAQALTWYQKALAIDPDNATIKKAIAALSK